MAITTDRGSTVTSKLEGVPGQKVGVGPVGVMVYLTTPAEVPVFTKVVLMLAPEPGVEIPVMVPPAGDVSITADHAKVLLATDEVMV